MLISKGIFKLIGLIIPLVYSSTLFLDIIYHIILLNDNVINGNNGNNAKWSKQRKFLSNPQLNWNSLPFN